MSKNSIPDTLLSMQQNQVPFYKMLQAIAALSRVHYRDVPARGQALWLIALIEKATVRTLCADDWEIQLVSNNLFILRFHPKESLAVPKTSLVAFTLSLVVVSSLKTPGMFLSIENAANPEESTLTLISDWHSSLEQTIMFFLRAKIDIEELVW